MAEARPRSVDSPLHGARRNRNDGAQLAADADLRADIALAETRRKDFAGRAVDPLEETQENPELPVLIAGTRHVSLSSMPLAADSTLARLTRQRALRRLRRATGFAVALVVLGAIVATGWVSAA